MCRGERTTRLLRALSDVSPRRIGPFTVLARIGAGGMGDVYLATPSPGAPVDRLVAVKTVRRDLADDPSFRRRFRREAALAAPLTAHTPSHRSMSTRTPTCPGWLSSTSRAPPSPRRSGAGAAATGRRPQAGRPPRRGVERAARGWDRPPGHQARECPARSRPCPPHRPGSRRPCPGERHRHRARPGGRYAGLHVSGASQGQPCRDRRVRCLQSRRSAVLRGVGKETVRGGTRSGRTAPHFHCGRLPRIRAGRSAGDP